MGYKRFLQIMFVIVFIFPVQSFAGKYVLTEGKDKEVCREYGKNLNSFKRLKHAMVCERQINPKFTDFRKPEWKELDVWENRELVWKMDLFSLSRRSKSDQDSFIKDADQWLERLKNRIRNNEIALYLTRVDIDNNGKLDNVIRYIVGSCSNTDELNFAYPHGHILIAFNDEMTAINEDLSSLMSTHQMGIFIYKDRTYLDYFGGFFQFKRGEVNVFDSVMSTTGKTSWTNLGAKICSYKYRK